MCTLVGVPPSWQHMVELLCDVVEFKARLLTMHPSSVQVGNLERVVAFLQLVSVCRCVCVSVCRCCGVDCGRMGMRVWGVVIRSRRRTLTSFAL